MTIIDAIEEGGEPGVPVRWVARFNTGRELVADVVENEFGDYDATEVTLFSGNADGAGDGHNTPIEAVYALVDSAAVDEAIFVVAVFRADFRAELATPGDEES